MATGTLHGDRRVLDRGEQRDVRFEPLDRRHEHVQWPSRTCSVSAVLITSRGLLAAHAALPSATRRSPRLRSASRGANGSTANSGSSLLGQHVGQRCERQARSPSGESPATREQTSRAAAATGSTCQPIAAARRFGGAAAAARSPPASPRPARRRRARRARSLGFARSACSGSAFTGSVGFRVAGAAARPRTR